MGPPRRPRGVPSPRSPTAAHCAVGPAAAAGEGGGGFVREGGRRAGSKLRVSLGSSAWGGPRGRPRRGSPAGQGRSGVRGRAPLPRRSRRFLGSRANFVPEGVWGVEGPPGRAAKPPGSPGDRPAGLFRQRVGGGGGGAGLPSVPPPAIRSARVKWHRDRGVCQPAPRRPPLCGPSAAGLIVKV